ncbi:MAG: hypothetical protein ACKV2U_28945 [Bryobacteraceae bacterium]
MIIQRVIKGISGLNDPDVDDIFRSGILCNWWRTHGSLLQHKVPDKLTGRNLDWHQNSFNKPDPLEGHQTFSLNTPFISTTAGTVDRDVANRTNTITPAWKMGLYFATNRWKADGWLFYCHLFLIGRRATAMEAFSEELRELNIYTGFSPVHPEGEITAKLVIPAAQIERAEFWSLTAARNAWNNGQLPTPARTRTNANFVKADDYNNLREFLV